MALRNRLTNLSSHLPKEATAILGRFSDQLTGYEKRVKVLVKDFDLKSREAREKSRKSLDQFVAQIKKTRTDVEKRVVGIVNEEGKRLNKRVNEVVSYLKSVSLGEANGTARKTTKKSSAKKTTATKKTRTSKKKISRPLEFGSTGAVSESLSQA